ncbi:hypothetical protein [Enterococcus sp. DIV0800]|uniref:hypothetical protein n=1 Tax=unclassified Enterococcus TaxID=2608891 RepID=UPI003D3015A4
MSMFIHTDDDFKEIAKFLNEKMNVSKNLALLKVLEMHELEAEAANARYGDTLEEIDFQAFAAFENSQDRNHFEILKRLDSIIYQASESDALRKTALALIQPLINEIDADMREVPAYKEYLAERKDLKYFDMADYELATTW